MIKSTRQSRVTTGVALAYLCAMAGCASHNSSSSTAVAPATMPRIATVDERYQSYNVEMLEVTGGNFWKPYGQKHTLTRKSSENTFWTSERRWETGPIRRCLSKP